MDFGDVGMAGCQRSTCFEDECGDQIFGGGLKPSRLGHWLAVLSGSHSRRVVRSSSSMRGHRPSGLFHGSGAHAGSPVGLGPSSGGGSARLVGASFGGCQFGWLAYLTSTIFSL